MKPPEDPFAGVELRDAPPSRELGERIVGECTRDLRPAWGLSRPFRWSITLACAALSCAALLAYRLEGSPLHLSAAVALSWGLGLAAASVFVLLEPPGRRLPESARWALVALALALFFVHVESLSDRVAPLITSLSGSETWGCALYALMTGGVAVSLVMLPWHRTDPLSPRLTGAFLGLCGGVAAGLAAAAVCPNHEAWHLALGHGLALAATVFAAAWLGRRWLAP